MARARFSMQPSRPPAHSGRMDIIAVAIAVAFFAAMLLVVEGLDRI
jgi:tRNA pseudouridine-54 N-methylase